MKKTIIFLLFIILIGCNKKSNDVTLNESWENIQKKSKGTVVNIYAWGGSEVINDYIDKYVGKNLKKQDITINRVPVDDIKVIMNKLLTEKIANKKDGSVDIIWINGENFKFAKENGLLWGEFAKILPNLNYVDEKTIQSDFGEPINYLEAPWGTAQFVFAYDSEKVTYPKNHVELKEIVKKYRGKFTYPQSSDFIGSVFLRQLFSSIDKEAYFRLVNEDLEESQIKKLLKPLWSYLNEIKPYLWREGKTYPESSGKMHELYSMQEIYFTMDYAPLFVESRIKNGSFTKATKTFLFENGTIFNNHYLSIPFNAKNKAAALMTINFLISFDAQYQKQIPNNWGDGNVLDFTKLTTMQKEKFDKIDIGDASISFDVLSKNRIPEIKSKYVEIIEKEWYENVAKN
ncbi:putative spermidine/putrescine transport system substrate-binding protein [Hypnocyclicus thermotrophus]|uniref:Spermidine/putrescine transport system substrate-binding protein n=1 Tax=Hypnocyclicus thermotrophus TaxID=1627895 RepID=A0AA46E0N6_9FUSO|nr:ABC transporter substrate-binding protein [Hypnocyclicus thermotrophus]TDT72599.1 putative spermidine/putrescine transport system substrate-binding protein [Hypnocyclicus thermotrophus]